MSSVMDDVDRNVVPEPFRALPHTRPGQVRETVEHDGRPGMPTPMRLVEGGDGIVAALNTDNVPALTDGLVRETLERTRR